MHKLHTVRASLVVLGGVLVGFMAFALAGFAHGGDEDVIHSCVNSSSGTIKIVSATTECTGNDVSLEWAIEGPPGEQGPPGPGPASITVRHASIPVSNVVTKTLTVNCLAGETALGGGHTVVPPSGNVDNLIKETLPFISRPTPSTAGSTPTGWEVQVRTVSSSNPFGLEAYVICSATS